MELFLLFLYVVSILVMYLSFQGTDQDEDYEEDSGEFNLMDFN